VEKGSFSFEVLRRRGLRVLRVIGEVSDTAVELSEETGRTIVGEERKTWGTGRRGDIGTGSHTTPSIGMEVHSNSSWALQRRVACGTRVLRVG